MPFLNYKALKLQLRVFLAGHTVAMVTYYVMERTTSCSPIVGQFFDTMIVASSDKKVAITTHQNLSAANCFEPPTLRDQNLMAFRAWYSLSYRLF